MSDELATLEQAAVSPAPMRLQGFMLTAYGLLPDPEGMPTFDEWSNLGSLLQMFEGGLPMWIGDWVNLGESMFGEAAAQAVDATGFQLATIQQYSWVAREVTLPRRRPGLSFGHYREVADLEPDAQTEWLERAACGDVAGGPRWSVARLRQELNMRNSKQAVWWLGVRCTSLEEAARLASRLSAEGYTLKGIPEVTE